MGGEEGLVEVKRIVMVSCRIFSRRKQNHQIRRWGGMSNSSRHRWYGTTPSADIIAHGVGVTTMRLLGASLVHRRWWGPKPPAAMISGKRDVSGETENENRGAKVS